MALSRAQADSGPLDGRVECRLVDVAAVEGECQAGESEQRAKSNDMGRKY